MVLSKVWGHVPIRSITLETPLNSVLTEQIDAVLDVTHEDTDIHDQDADLRSETYFDIAHGTDDADVTGNLTIKNVTKSVTFPSMSSAASPPMPTASSTTA